MGDSVQAKGGPTQAPKDAWGDPVTAARAGVLSGHLQHWKNKTGRGDRRGPFDGMRLTGADVFWLAGATLCLEASSLSQAQAEAQLRNPKTWDNLTLQQLHLEGALLTSAQLHGAFLVGVHLEGADLDSANLTDAVLVQATFDRASRLNNVQLAGASVDQVAFDTANLTGITWADVRVLGDERRASRRWQETTEYKKTAEAVHRREPKRPNIRSREYRAAARAYRLLSVQLRAQGLSSPATRFQYRASVMERKADIYEARSLLFSKETYKVPSLVAHWLVSFMLSAIAGYGVYHLWRLFITYLVLVLGFALLYYGLAHHGLYFPSSLREVLDALALSVTTFHGRGLQSGTLNLQGSAMDVAATTEAIFGLLLEGLFIASFTRRILGS